MLTKITDTFWIDLDRIIIINTFPENNMESYAIFQLINNDRKYYLTKNEFDSLLKVYQEYIYKPQFHQVYKPDKNHDGQ